MESSPTIIDKARATYADVVDQLGSATPSQLGLLGLTAAGIVFEWSTGNESYLGLIGGNLYDTTDSTIATGIGTGLASFAEQFALGTVMASSIKKLPGITRCIGENFGIRADDDCNTDKTTLLSRFQLAFFLGSSGVLVVENTKQDRSFTDNMKSNAKSSALIGAGVVGLVSATSTAVDLASKYGHEVLAENFIDVVKNPLSYLGLLCTSIGYSKFKKMINKRRS